jgi:hypothetical protein
LREPYQIGGIAVSVGASVGTAVAPAGDSDVDALLHAADVAMYAIKGVTRRLRRPEGAAPAGPEAASGPAPDSISLVEHEASSPRIAGGMASMVATARRIPAGRRRPRP